MARHAVPDVRARLLGLLPAAQGRAAPEPVVHVAEEAADGGGPSLPAGTHRGASLDNPDLPRLGSSAGAGGRLAARFSGRRSTAGSARGLLVGVGLLLVVVAWWWWQGRPADITPAPSSATLAAPETGTPGSGDIAASGGARGAARGADAPARVVVHVVGDVRTPGVFRLPRGSRVEAAVQAAGGVRPGGRLGAVNLARLLADGEQIVVGARAASLPPASGSSAASAPSVLDLNTATESELEGLPGIGPVLAARIVAWRAAHGPFADVAELKEVSGIGAATYSDIAPMLRV